MFDTMEAPETPAVALSEGSFFDTVEQMNHHHDVRSTRGAHPLVQGTSYLWYKMLSLYYIWGWISMSCPAAGYVLMSLTNDGGVFYNECYYMFYNGVVWYNPPKEYIPSHALEETA